jgi:hypothetical protein
LKGWRVAVALHLYTGFHLPDLPQVVGRQLDGPRAETSRPLRPRVRVCMVVLLPLRLGSADLR